MILNFHCAVEGKVVAIQSLIESTLVLLKSKAFRAESSSRLILWVTAACSNDVLPSAPHKVDDVENLILRDKVPSVSQALDLSSLVLKSRTDPLGVAAENVPNMFNRVHVRSYCRPGMDDTDLLSCEVSLCFPGTMGRGVVLLYDVALCHMRLQDGGYVVGLLR
ncbi:hypothetical protein PoB_006688300 [Plakobranchus ocellatus]|uniref:Uncharacterized protein n=1 Tax=Plakobranchus ocellatus TaxID=259542 RepID=A0AAV4D826_9GAST|nr:hypothetical protein PoB_006688300 [Plakobranchus ocellatus]